MFEADQTRSLPRENLNAPTPGISPRWPGSRAPQYTFANGEVVLDRFRIIRLVGTGGMGEVYEAEDLIFGRVALKTIRGEFLGNSDLVERFRREVHTARSITHAGVCRVHELFTIESTRPGTPPTHFLGMEFLDGQTLAHKLQQDGPYSWREAEVILRAICQALEAIHAEKIIHRDLKPSNIMLVEKNGACRVVLTDFGLAVDSRAQSADGYSPQMVAHQKTGLAGTLDYMAPEQFIEQDANKTPISAATDIYALGIVLYELLTGINPYAPEEDASATPDAANGTDAPRKRQITTDPVEAAIRRGRRPPRPSSLNPSIPHGWDSVIYRCLEYHPTQRYQRATEVAEALHTHRTAAGSLAVQTKSLVQRPAGWVGIAVLVAAIFVAAWLWRNEHVYHHLNPRLQKKYDEAVAAIREGTYFKATQLLQSVEDQDPSHAMTHARLAEAWYELDFTGNAQQELLQASNLDRHQHLPHLDSMYLQACASTVTRNFAGAAKEYGAILALLPDSEKPDGYVDLGRAEVEAGKIAAALEDYQQAARLEPDTPAAFVQIGRLQSRLQKKSSAEAAFSQADRLYRAEVNEEGIAQVAYQRGVAANSRGDSKDAEKYLNEAVAIAKQISSVQVEAAALAQLSDMTSEAGDDPKAAQVANQIIELARQNGLRYWEAIGLLRLANTYLDQTEPSELRKAELPIGQAMAIAQMEHYAGAEAEAQLELASFRDMQHRPSDVIPAAKAARDYYMSLGFNENGAGAWLLLIRAQSDQGDLRGALESSVRFSQAAKLSGGPRDQFLGEESTAINLLRIERYPEALEHFRAAISLGRSAADQGREAESSAMALWNLGRYEEAEKILKTYETNAMVDGAVRTQILLSKTKYVEAMVAEKRLTQEHPALQEDSDIRMIRVLLELHAGSPLLAAEQNQKILLESRGTGNKSRVAEAQLAESQIQLYFRSPLKAKDAAIDAANYFHASGQKTSEFIGQSLLSRSLADLRHSTDATNAAAKALDILHGLRDTWPPADYQSFIRRPDIKEVTKIVTRLTKEQM